MAYIRNLSTPEFPSHIQRFSACFRIQRLSLGDMYTDHWIAYCCLPAFIFKFPQRFCFFKLQSAQTKKRHFHMTPQPFIFLNPVFPISSETYLAPDSNIGEGVKKHPVSDSCSLILLICFTCKSAVIIKKSLSVSGKRCDLPENFLSVCKKQFTDILITDFRDLLIHFFHNTHCAERQTDLCAKPSQIHINTLLSLSGIP